MWPPLNLQLLENSFQSEISDNAIPKTCRENWLSRVAESTVTSRHTSPIRITFSLICEMEDYKQRWQITELCLCFSLLGFLHQYVDLVQHCCLLNVLCAGMRSMFMFQPVPIWCVTIPLTTGLASKLQHLLCSCKGKDENTFPF